MTKTRAETDTFGPIDVDASRYSGAQAERSRGNFKIGWGEQPAPIVPRSASSNARRLIPGTAAVTQKATSSEKAPAMTAAVHSLTPGSATPL